MQASFEGRRFAELVTEAESTGKGTASVRNGDLADVMVLSGQPPVGYSGALSMNANVNGTIGNPDGNS